MKKFTCGFFSGDDLAFDIKFCVYRPLPPISVIRAECYYPSTDSPFVSVEIQCDSKSESWWVESIKNELKKRYLF